MNVEMPDGKVIAFPDSMGKAEIDTILNKEYGSQPAAPSEPEAPEWAGKYPNLYGAVGAAKEVARFGAETAALVGGGIAGAPAGPAGALVGAGLAFGGVKAAERYLEGEKATLPGAAWQSAKDVATGMAMEAGGQLVGRGVKAVTKRITKPTRSDVPQSKIEERLALAESQGIQLTPAEATGSKGLALYESMLDKSPFSTSIINSMRELRQLRPLIALREKLIQAGGKPQQVEVLGQQIQDEVNKFLGQYKSMNEAQLNTLRDNVLKKMGSSETFETLGKAAQESIAKKSMFIYGKANELYADVGKLIPKGSVIVPNNTKQAAAMLLEQESKKPPSLQNPSIQKVLRDLSGADDVLEEQINAYPEGARAQIRAKLAAEGQGGYDWKTIQSIRSELNSRIAQSDAAIKAGQPNAKFQSSPEAGIYKQLKKSLDRDIEEFATAEGGEIKEAFDLANAFYKEGKLTYNYPTIKRILNANPERVVDMVFRPNGGLEIDAVRNAVGKEVFNTTVKPAIVKRLVGEGGTFSPKELSGKLKTYGDDVLAKVFDKQELKMIRDLAADGHIQLEQNMAGHPFLKTLAKERPEVVVDSIIGTHERFPGSKMTLRNVALIRSVVPKETFMSLQREMSDRIFKLNQLTGQVQPEKLSKTIQTYDRVLKLFYSPEQVQWLRDISRTGSLMASAERSASNPSGTAQNVITWGTWGALLRNPVTGAINGILAPQAMARIYLSQRGRAWLMNATKTPLNSGKAAELYTKLLGIAGADILAQQELEQSYYQE
jgi:hypothetical protein